ncbi:uncharacterized protein CLUP02_16981 [Colletotrichum lupini]|uniref:Uncharacterized protein n=1 Tax=Colletotrichum lupini TaxID=145971 RepID=A0A9Q8WQ69_9PEZI|nr:uncharacterized protein CLUP02_16981 [Colletotrichum lupini]UQC91446.1 hypothetical protein CLUP02_16981 [Colletotrichum lupini]
MHRLPYIPKTSDEPLARVQPFSTTTLYSTPNHQSQKSGRHLNIFFQPHFGHRKLTEIKGLAENASGIGSSGPIGIFGRLLS